MNNATRTTDLPEDFNVFTSSEITRAVAIVRESKSGETVSVFGVPCVRRGWFQIIGRGTDLRSASLVRLVANSPSIRRAAIIATCSAISAEMYPND